MSGLSFEQGWQAQQVKDQERAEEREAERLSQVPSGALEWLAIVPVWTVGLARACGFPTGEDQQAQKTLQRIHFLGLCHRAPPVPTPGQPDPETSDPDMERFWMSADQRGLQLSRTIRDSPVGRVEIQRTVREVAARIDQQSRSGVPVLPIVERWVTLASGDDPAEIGRRLLEQVEMASTEPAGLAARWLEAARPLEEIFKGEVTAAFVRALRRQDYKDRLDADRRMLAKYVVRPDQVQSFDELMHGSDEVWALHYVGAGGVGKTMLMRYLSGDRIPSLGGSSARVDFDHINPDYPSRAPGLLLVQLAEELRLQAPANSTEDLFFSFFDKMTTLHEQLGSGTAAAPVDAIASPLFALALDYLVEAMRRLPQPVVLLIDTCEELSKVQLEGGPPRNVSETFRILEELHRRDTRLRVVFCGRRLLGQAGSGWSTSATEWRTGPARSYLRLHVMRGFDHGEAERFLAGQGVPARLWQAILAKSPAVGFSLQGEGTAAHRPGEQYSPYVLDLHTDWVRENPGLTAEEIRDNPVDPFVQIRILSRLPSSLTGLLPAVALVGCFDQATLLAAADADPDGFEGRFRELADQEWITRLGSGLVEVQREMQPRLLAYLRNTHGPDLETVRRRAIEHLKQKSLRKSGQVPVSELAPAELAAMLSLLELFPQEGARWWDRIEKGLARAGANDWAETLARLLLADGAVAGIRETCESPLRAAILATLAAALTRSGRPVDTVPFWREVLEKAPRHPLAAGAERLRLRATAALAGAGAIPTSDLTQAVWEVIAAGLDNQAAASVLAALERIAERLEGEVESGPEPTAALDLSGSLIGPMRKLDPGLNAALRVVAARLCLLARRSEKARDHFGAALGARRRLDSPRQGWLDWASPADLSSRVALEFVRGTWARLLPAHEVDERLGMAPSKPAAGIDGDRLYSARLLLSESLAAAGRPDASPLRDVSSYQRPVCRAHLAFPSAFAAAARSLCDAGRVDEVLESLQSRALASESASTELDSVQEAHRAWFYTAFRMRLLPEDGPGPTSPLLAPAAIPSDQDLANRWFAILPASARSSQGLDPASRAWARRRPLNGKLDEVAKLVEEQAGHLRAAPPPRRPATLEELEGLADALELERLAAMVGIRPGLRAPATKLPRDWEDLLLRLPPAEAVVATLLRMWACEGPRRRRPYVDRLAERLGIRRAAWIALDEGTLLVSRLPAGGIALLELGARWFAQAGDSFGALLAEASLALEHLVGQRRAFAAVFRRLGKTYEECRERLTTPLATWDQLREFAMGEITPDAWGSRLWQPWLLRLAVCVAWAEDGKRGGPRSRRVLDALSGFYGEKQGKAWLPPDLELLPGTLAESPESQKIESAKSFTVEDVTARPFRLRLRPATYLESWPIRNQAIEIEVAVESDVPNLRVSVHPGFGPYAEQSRRLAAPDDRLERLIRSKLEQPGAGASRLDCTVLDLDHSLAWICWEALLSLPLAYSDPVLDLPIFRRTLAETRLRKFTLKGVPVGLFSFSPSLAELSMSHAGWQRLREDPRFKAASLRSKDFPGEVFARVPAQVVHLVGRPISTSSGPRLEIGEAAEESRTVGRGRRLLSARDLLRRVPRVQLVVLQAPATRTPDRSSSEREQAAYLRMIAAELHNAGVPVVVVVPPLAQETGAQVLAELADAICEPGPSFVDSLPRFVQRARLRILDGRTATPTPDLVELLLDLAFYGPDTLDWPRLKEDA